MPGEARLREQAQAAVKNSKLPARAPDQTGAVLARGWNAPSASGQ
jgi:hypothetical protein